MGILTVRDHYMGLYKAIVDTLTTENEGVVTSNRAWRPDLNFTILRTEKLLMRIYELKLDITAEEIISHLQSRCMDLNKIGREE